MQFGHISQFAHGSVRFLRIECNAAFISRFLYYQMRQAGDGYFFSRADVTKLHELGWHHKIDKEEGVHKMYQWYLEYKKK